MCAARHSHESSTDRLPLREFASHPGQRSRSPSPPARETSGPDGNISAIAPDQDTREASNSLLRHTGMCASSGLDFSGSDRYNNTVAHTFQSNVPIRYQPDLIPEALAMQRPRRDQSETSSTYCFPGWSGVESAGV